MPQDIERSLASARLVQQSPFSICFVDACQPSPAVAHQFRPNSAGHVRRQHVSLAQPRIPGDGKSRIGGRPFSPAPRHGAGRLNLRFDAGFDDSHLLEPLAGLPQSSSGESSTPGPGPSTRATSG